MEQVDMEDVEVEEVDVEGKGKVAVNAELKQLFLLCESRD